MSAEPSYLDELAAQRLARLGTQERAWPTLDAARAYSGVIGEVTELIEPNTESDPAAILLQSLVFAGSAMGRRAHYLVEGDKHHTNLNVVLVGQSSKGRKGTSMGQVRRLFEFADRGFTDSCITSGLSSGEGLIWQVRDESEGDEGVFDKRLLVTESEFAGVLRVMQREGNIISRVVRDAWDRGDLSVLTKKMTTKATGAHISIIGHITSDELKRYLDRTEAANGFANRFLFAAVKRSKCLPFGGHLDTDLLRILGERIGEAIRWSKDMSRIYFDDDARAMWIEVYPELSSGAPGLYGSVTGRAEAQVVRIALIYALLDRSRDIRLEHLLAALAIWDYADESAKHVFGDTEGDPVKDRIISALRSENDGLSLSQISAACGRHVRSERIGLVLEALRVDGKAERKFIETQGRPKEVWRAT